MAADLEFTTTDPQLLGAADPQAALGCRYPTSISLGGPFAPGERSCFAALTGHERALGGLGRHDQGVSQSDSQLLTCACFAALGLLLSRQGGGWNLPSLGLAVASLVAFGYTLYKRRKGRRMDDPD